MSKLNHFQTTAVLQILISCFIWALSFIFTKWCLVHWDPFWLITARFYLPAFLSFFAIIYFYSLPQIFEEMKIAVLPGLALGLHVIFWTWGLKYTSVANSGFISVIYVLIVPIISAFFFKQRLTWMQWFFILLGFLGVCVMCDFTQLHRLNIGDGYTLICSFLAAIHILMTESAAHRSKNPFVYNAFQAFFSGTVGLFSVLFLQKNPLVLPALSETKAWIGFLCLSLGTVFIANFLQVKAQKHMSSTTTALFFLMEAPLAALLALVVLNEDLSPTQLIGGILVFMAVYGTVKTTKKL